MTLSIMTFRIMTRNTVTQRNGLNCDNEHKVGFIMSLSTTTLSIMIPSIMTLNITIFNVIHKFVTVSIRCT